METKRDFSQFGRRLKSLRAQSNLTQKELRAALRLTKYHIDIGQPYLSDLENSKGEKLPSIPLLCAFSEVLNTTPGYLLEMTDDPSPHVRADDKLVFSATGEADKYMYLQAFEILRDAEPEDRVVLLRLMSRYTGHQSK